MVDSSANLAGMLDAVRPKVRSVRNALAARRTPGTVARFHRLYYEHSARTWGNTTWLGVRTLKCPLDLWVYQELLFRTHPDLVIETGTAAGGSALFIASCMDIIGNGRVMTVDINERAERPQHPRIEYITGSSVAPEVLSRIRSEAERVSSVMVILDSDHSADHVLAELRSYSELVTPGSYLIVEDTNVNGRPVFAAHGPGPREALDRFLGETSAFVTDTDCEKFFLTFNPGGFLRRLEST